MKRLLSLILILFVFAFSFSDAAAQCSICQGTVESSRNAGSSVADGINKGVLYIFMMPYLIIGTVGYFWWRARKKVQH